MRLAADDLGRDPLARVVGGAVEHRGARAVGRVARVVGDLDRQDRLAEQRRADLDELDDVRVVAGEAAQLVGDAAGLGVAAEDVVVRVRAVAAGRAGGLRAELRERLLLQLEALVRRAWPPATGTARGSGAGCSRTAIEADVVELGARLVGDELRLLGGDGRLVRRDVLLARRAPVLAASSETTTESAKCAPARHVDPPPLLNGRRPAGYENLIGIQGISRGGRSTPPLGRPPMRFGGPGRSFGACSPSCAFRS